MKDTYKRPSIAATVAVFAKNDNAFLLIRRTHEPFKGKYAFPGGFLEVDKEDLYEAAVRELAEEAGISLKKENLQLIDVRSDPKRDPREHVVDVGFIYIIEKIIELSPATDEIPVWITLNQLNDLDFAFDHGLFWNNLKEYLARENLIK